MTKNYSWKSVAVVCVFLFGVALCCFGSCAIADQVSAGSQSVDSRTSGVSASENGLVSMDFQDAPLGVVLRVLSDQTKMNFIIGNEMRERKITIYLNNVTGETAVNSILKSNNLIFEEMGEKGSRIYVVRESGLPEVPLITRSFCLKFFPVSDQVIDQRITQDDRSVNVLKIDGAGSVIGKMLSDRGSYVVDQRTNTIIITDVSSKMELVEKILASLDVKSPQVMIEAEIIETKADLLKEFGMKWGSGANGTMFRIAGAQRLTKFPWTNAKSLLNRTTSSEIPDLLDWASYADTADPLRGVISFAEMQIALEAMEQDSDTKILAKPKILTLNNYPALIKITSNTAIASLTETTSAEGIATQITKAERTITGVVLRVLPQINKDGYITMKVMPEVIVALASEFFPDIYSDPHTRSAETTVMIKDGETLIIGGLLSTTDVDTIRKVPILGDVPVLGLAFRHNERKKVDKDLMIFIRPKIISETADGVSDIKLAGSGSSLGGKGLSATREQSAGSRDEVIARTIDTFRSEA